MSLDNFQWLDVGIAIFGIGFTVWGFYVRRGTHALTQMRASIETIVALKLENIERRLDELIDTTKAADARIYNLELNHEKRIALLERELRS